MTGQQPPVAGGPGVVRVRLSGLPAGTEAMAALLTSCPGVNVLTGPDGPYPNRRPPGHRLFLTVQLTQPPLPKPEPPQEKETPMSSTCPECGEPAVHQPPDDLVPYQAHGTEPPQWSHPDRSSLCPVMTPDGYRPAGPGEPETAGPDVPIPYTLTPEAEAYLGALGAGLDPAAPEPEAEL